MYHFYPSSFFPISFAHFFFFLAAHTIAAHNELDTTTTMGKKTAGLKSKRASGRAEEEASRNKIDCDWAKSPCRAQDLEDLREEGLLAPLEELKTCASGKDVIPCPREGERVCFVDFE